MMLVECATTSTNNVSISISAASSSQNCTVINTLSAAATTFSTGVTTSTTTIPTSSVAALGSSNPGSSTASIVVSVSTPDGLSSGSNSCSNSIGHSISTTSNSISNSNSIGNSWRVGSDHFNGRRGSTEKSLGNSSGDYNLGHSRGDPAEFSQSRNIEYRSGATNKIPNDAPSSYVKYGSPLSEYKYGKELTKPTSGEQTPAKNMVDVEACLASTPPHLLIRSLSSLSHHSTQLSTLPRSPEREESGGQSLQKGVLQQARDRLFSRWKERYFVLTRDYLACFRRGSTKYSEMGSFIFKVNLASVEGVWWEERRGGAVVAVGLPREGRVLLRPRSHDDTSLQVWYRSLLDATTASRLRRTALRRGTSTTHLHINNTTTLPHPSPSGTSCGSSSSECEDLRRAAPAPQRGSLDTDPPSTPPSSLTSSHQFSTNTSSGSGCGSSVASSPGLGTGGGSYNPPGGWSPRSRFSLVESPRRLLQSAAVCPPKTRHSLCLEPPDLAGPSTTTRLSGPLVNRSPVTRSPGGPLASTSLSGTPTGSRSGITSAFPSGRRFLPSPAGQSRRSLCLDSLSASRTSLLSLTPRNPLLELLENSPPPGSSSGALSSSAEHGSSPRGAGGESNAPNPLPATLAQPRTRTSLTLFRNSPLFN